jgi:hypothetical protein
VAANRRSGLERSLQGRLVRARLARRSVVVVLTIILAVAATATIAAALVDRPPSQPPWVKNDNTVDSSKLPASFPVLGPDGRPLLHPDGSPVTVDGSSLSKGPSLDPATAAQQARQDHSERTVTPDGVEKVATRPTRPK